MRRARGIPSHDALNDLFNALDHEAFRDSFVAWAENLRTAVPGLAGPEVVHPISLKPSSPQRHEMFTNRSNNSREGKIVPDDAAFLTFMN